MAESLAVDIAEKVLEKLASLAYEEICLAWGFKSELNKLEGTLSTIKAVLSDAEEQQAKNRQLSIWLEKLQDVCRDADDVLDEFEYEVLWRQVVNRGRIKRKVRNFFSRANPLAFRFNMGHKIKEIRARLDDIAAEKAKFHLTERVEDGRIVRRERVMTHSFVRTSDVIGREDDKKQIIELLMHSGDGGNVSIIPLVGIGGMGKTTLAKLVYNHESIVRHFELKMWVCVSEDFDVPRLTKEITKSATGKSCDDLTIDQLQTSLRSTLDNKRFLLILDDVWNDDRGKWIDLRDLLMVGASGSKVIVTTRSPQVASVMGTIPAYYLKGLPHDYCLSLFVKWAFKEGEEKRHPNLLKIGDEIVKKCGGVPLAVRTLGSHLYSKTDERDWLFIKDNEIWKLEQKENEILLALRLSYDAMPTYLKQCFSFCAIFPKGYKFYRNKLIQMWMAHGLLRSSNENEELEEIGKRYIKELWARSLIFQDIEEYSWLYTFKMHDLAHDLALLVAQTECFAINSNTRIICKRVQHVSFWEGDLNMEEVPRPFLELNNVRTILFPLWCSQSFAEKCISRFKCLRVLDLSDSCFEVLPSSISNLKHLRFLDLSRNRSIKKLPNFVCKLLHLQTLRLDTCDEFEELPRDIGNLIGLRCLLLTTKQMYLPMEGIGSLISLQFLQIARCGRLESLGEGMQRLSGLRTLLIWQCKNLLSLPSMKFLTALEYLAIEDCPKLTSMDWEEDIQGLRLSLRWLWINKLPQVVALPQWVQRAAGTLQQIHVQDCDLRTLPEWLQNLTSLQKLEIINCPLLSTMPEGMHLVTALTELTIERCPELSRRCRRETGEDWLKIAHIPEITLECQKIQSTDN